MTCFRIMSDPLFYRYREIFIDDGHSGLFVRRKCKRLHSEMRDTTSPRIAVVGSVNIDLVTRAPRLPVPGGRCSAPISIPSMVAGARTRRSRLRAWARRRDDRLRGDDAFGARLHDALSARASTREASGADRRTATGVATITVDEGGANSIVVVPGANARLDADRIDAARDAIAGGAMLVSQLEVPVATVARAIACASAHRRCCSIPRPRSRCSTRCSHGSTTRRQRNRGRIADRHRGRRRCVRRARRRCAVREGRGQRAGHARRARRVRAAVRTQPPAGDVGGRRRYDRGRRHRRRLRGRSRGGASMDDAIGFGQRAAASA